MNYDQAMEYLDSIAGCGIVPGLDSIRQLCSRLGDPQKNIRWVHIAGTNGKGSVLAYISTILSGAGYRVGRYLSPTIREYRERIQVNGKMIPKTALCRHLETVKTVCDQMVAEGLPQPTPFEVETAVGFLFFQEKGCQIGVLECGMGGLLDATNLIEDTLVSVIASIGMDHMKFLGGSLEKIAEQKAGIIKKGSAVVCMRQDERVEKVIAEKAEEMGAELFFSDASHAKNVKYGLEKQTFDFWGMKKLEISLAGQFQVSNAILAVNAVKVLAEKGFPVSEKDIREGLKNTIWPGRFTILGKKPLMIADGAHNEDAAQKLAKSIEFYFTNRRIIYIMGVLKDKEYDKVIALTHRFADQIITVTPPENPRALAAIDLAKEVAKVHPLVTAAESVEEAVEMAKLLAGKEDVILAFGSLSYLGRLMDVCGYEPPAKGKARRK